MHRIPFVVAAIAASILAVTPALAAKKPPAKKPPVPSVKVAKASFKPCGVYFVYFC